ncbi:hypothetical protein DsansV1_C19g0155801 [Dioscorea sansibarensis]
MLNIGLMLEMCFDRVLLMLETSPMKADERLMEFNLRLMKD